MVPDIMATTHRILVAPFLHVVLYQPEIPANTGNIARLCGAAELALHLIHPLGFKVTDRNLKRAGLDYWHEVDVRHHPDFDAFLAGMAEGSTLVAFSSHASEVYTRARIRRGDYLLFGQESRGLPPGIREAYPSYRVPIRGKVRSLNLSTTVGIVAYHYLYVMGLF
jgi:tRNA (cytidine/uridine-2'-O-)-methyltransferase